MATFYFSAAERSLEVKKSAESTSLSQEIGAFTDCEMSITSFMLAHDLLPNTEEESDSYQESSDTEIQGNYTSYWQTVISFSLLYSIRRGLE